MEMFKCDPGKIKVREGLERTRTEMGDLEGLADSFKRTRQIVPIIITRNFELIDGGRRLAACILAKIDVLCVYQDVADDFEIKELELEANLHRKDYTPAEEVAAVKELHELKQRRLGATSPGVAGGHTIKDTAKLLGRSKASVINDLEMAMMVEAFPQLAHAKKKSDIKRAVQGMQKILTASDGLEKHEEAIASGKKMYKLSNIDAIEHMQRMKTDSVDILLTDPLYGIEADKNIQGIGKAIGGELNTSGYKIKDDNAEAFRLVSSLAKESSRFCKDNAHGFVFCAPEYFSEVSNIFKREDWIPYVRPMIWIKRVTGQSNQPTMWPVAAYEMAIYLRKPKSRLAKEGLPDWSQCDPVLPAMKLHPYEKPIGILMKWLEMVAIPGQILYDPFMGSGASIEAGLRYNLFCHGTDIDKNAYASTIHRISEYDRTKDSEDLASLLFAGTELEGNERKTVLNGVIK